MSTSLPASVRGGRGRVLIVDDNADLADTLRAVLVSGIPGLAIEIAENGRAALEKASRGFDVALVDVKLPDVSGIDLIAPLKAATPFAEILLVTGYASIDAAIDALRSGAFAFVLKSFRPPELLSIVEQALDKSRLKRERAELERRYRDLVEVTDALAVAVDENERVTLMNRKAAALAHTSSDAAVGQPFVETWIPAEDRVAMRAALTATLDASHGPSAEVETEFSEPTASPRTRRRVRWHLSRSSDEPPLAYAIGIDITDRRALERRAADAEALSAMGELAMNLAHEIRNPLNAAVLQLHLLKRNQDRLAADSETRAMLQDRVRIVGDEIGRLNRLLTEFLELARPRGIAREPVHLPRLVDEVLDLEEESAKGRGVAIARALPQDGCVALGDREKFKQVILNIVVNALEAMKDGGRLMVEVRAVDEHVVMAFEDTGGGIAPEVLGSVFAPFFTTKEAGTGLGLSIVRKIVDQHGGDVRIESERGKGARVTVSIPTGR